MKWKWTRGCLSSHDGRMLVGGVVVVATLRRGGETPPRINRTTALCPRAWIWLFSSTIRGIDVEVAHEVRIQLEVLDAVGL